MCPPPTADELRAILDMWCTWLLSKKTGFVAIPPVLAQELRAQVVAYGGWRDDDALPEIVRWLDRFASDSETIEIGTRHEFNQAMLALIRRHAGGMTEEGKMILLNVINAVERAAP